MYSSQRQLFLQHMAQTSPAPLCIEVARAEGHYLFDTLGKKYLDLISGISVCNTGHCHPQIVSAIQQQVEKYMHTMVYGEFIQSPQVDLAALLTAQLPASLQSCYFVNSGSEAVEGALKLAKRVTGRSRFVALKNAYHGSSHAPLSLMSNEYFSAPFRPLLSGVTFMEQNHLADLNLIDTHTAAVVMELVQAEKGAVPCDLEFVQQVRSRCDETGTLLIFDEIQTGMGRTGKLFAFEDYGVLPDILLLGKAFGGGMPLGAFVASTERMGLLSNNPVLGHITTFGGHPVSCAAGLAALKITLEQLENWQVEEKGKIFKQELEKATGLEVTGKGLLLALDVKTEENCQKTIKECLENGLFTDWFLFAPHKLRIAPPLGIELNEITTAVSIIANAVLKFI